MTRRRYDDCQQRYSDTRAVTDDRLDTRPRWPADLSADPDPCLPTRHRWWGNQSGSARAPVAALPSAQPGSDCTGAYLVGVDTATVTATDPPRTGGRPTTLDSDPRGDPIRGPWVPDPSAHRDHPADRRTTRGSRAGLRRPTRAAHRPDPPSLGSPPAVGAAAPAARGTAAQTVVASSGRPTLDRPFTGGLSHHP